MSGGVPVTRVQVLLTEEQDRRLERLARRRRVSKSSLVRGGIELLLRQAHQGRTDPLLDLIGQAGATGLRDASIRHDKYLAAFERRRNR